MPWLSRNANSSMKIVPAFEGVGCEDDVVVLEGGVGDCAILVRSFLNENSPSLKGRRM